MKHNWTYKKLGELVDVLNGFAFKSSNYVKDGIRVIRIANVQKGKIVDEAPAFYPLSAESGLTRYMLHEDDILLSLTGNVGRVGLLPKEMLPAALNQRVACLRIKDDTLMFKFLYQFLNSDYFEQKCIESSRGIAQLNMSTEWLKDYPLPIPSLDEQKAIVAELDGINRLIELQEEQLREYDRLAQSLFYSTFGDPVSNPKGWEVKKLGEVAPSVKYKGLIKGNGDKYWLLNLDMVESQTGNVIDYLWVDKDEVGGSTTTFSEDYVLYSKLRPYLNKVVLPNQSGYCTTELLPLLPSKELHRVYLAFVLRAASFVDYIQTKVAGAKMPRVTMDDFRGFNIPLPPLSLQQSFAAQIEVIEQQKALIRRSLDETRTLLAARMQYYFE